MLLPQHHAYCPSPTSILFILHPFCIHPFVPSLYTCKLALPAPEHSFPLQTMTHKMARRTTRQGQAAAAQQVWCWLAAEVLLQLLVITMKGMVALQLRCSLLYGHCRRLAAALPLAAPARKLARHEGRTDPPPALPGVLQLHQALLNSVAGSWRERVALLPWTLRGASSGPASSVKRLWRQPAGQAQWPAGAAGLFGGAAAAVLPAAQPLHPPPCTCKAAALLSRSSDQMPPPCTRRTASSG